MFKYMALYSIIQFVSVMILYSIMSNLGDIMFLYIDICIITVVAILMGRSEAYDKIVTKKPLTHLMTTPILVSILLQILVQVAIQTAAFYILKAQVWYEPLEADTEDYDANIVCYETTTIFLVSVFQYLIVAVAFSTGKPYTKPIYRNFLYTGALVLLTLVSIFIVLAPIDWLEHFFEMGLHMLLCQCSSGWAYECLYVSVLPDRLTNATLSVFFRMGLQMPLCQFSSEWAYECHYVSVLPDGLTHATLSVFFQMGLHMPLCQCSSR
ncbi:polyamine-transporting ATPase 13A3-like [Saccoglossus kowalevskii]|uniref:Probable cation-transporting ATPase 13A3-like n=1 Tax=Saccoglossus kowalevskii TaxID=10224 RepID=A0ABM0MLF6_SACKO|nr:PREDICTED: probable cation-transporting ATPase 13A3-like [Saccoglossus kowalevskii]